MNKGELIDKVAECAGLTKAEARRAINCYHEIVTGALKKGTRVGFVGFGSYSVVTRKARIGRNPKTGMKIKIAAKKTVKFKAGKELLTKVKK